MEQKGKSEKAFVELKKAEENLAGESKDVKIITNSPRQDEKAFKSEEPEVRVRKYGVVSAPKLSPGNGNGKTEPIDFGVADNFVSGVSLKRCNNAVGDLKSLFQENSIEFPKNADADNEDDIDDLSDFVVDFGIGLAYFCRLDTIVEVEEEDLDE